MTALSPLLMHWRSCSIALNHWYIKGLAQDCSNSIDNTLGLLQSCHQYDSEENCPNPLAWLAVLLASPGHRPVGYVEPWVLMADIQNVENRYIVSKTKTRVDSLTPYSVRHLHQHHWFRSPAWHQAITWTNANLLRSKHRNSHSIKYTW